MMEAQFWIDHVAAIDREGISARAYAQRQGISISAVYYWQRKMRAAPAGQVTARPSNKFLAVRVAGPVIAPRSLGCTLILSSGLRLEMATLPAPEWLAALGHAAQGVR